MRSAVFAAALVEYLTSGKLIAFERVAEVLGSELTFIVPFISGMRRYTVREGRLAFPVEDYLQGIITLVNELVYRFVGLQRSAQLTPSQSRLAVNAVTMGNFDEPIRISIFVKDLYAGFSVVAHIYLLPENFNANCYIAKPEK